MFKDGHIIALNNPSLIIEDWSGEHGRVRHMGQIKIKAWQKLNQVLPIVKSLALPDIVFYE